MQTSPRHRVPRHLGAGGQAGFTLLELLVVIAVLGVLSGVTVFSMGTIADRAAQSACAADERTLMTAVEAYAVTAGSYADQETLVAAGYLRSASTSHDVVLTADGYSIVPTGDCVAGGTDEIAEGDPAAPDGDAGGSDGPAEVDGSNKNDGKVEEDGKVEGAKVEEDGKVEGAKVEGDGRDGGEIIRGRDRAGVDNRPADTKDGADTASCAKGQVDLNTASVKELTTIAHMNPSKAEAAVKLRPFTSVDDLVRVEGVEKKHLEQIHQQGSACV